MKKILSSALIIMLMILHGCAWASEWYVIHAGEDEKIKYSSESWDSARESEKFATLSAFLANKVQTNDTVYISGGTYKPASTIELKKNIKIYGGFSGHEKNLSERNISQNNTIIDGKNEQQVLKITAQVEFDGLAIMNGNAAIDGGGIYIDGNGNATLKNCTIISSKAVRNGGGIYVKNGGVVTIDNCSIKFNSALNGGGIFLQKNIQTINNSTISDNEAEYGGGVHVNSSTTTLTNCTITNNKSSQEGGGIYNPGGTLNVINCTLVNNFTLKGGEISNKDKLNLTNSILYGTSEKIIVNANDQKLKITQCAGNFDDNNENVNFFNSWEPVSSNITINGVTHTVFTIEDNPVLYEYLVEKGINSEQIPKFDQLGTERATPPAIGAIETKYYSINLPEKITAAGENVFEKGSKFYAMPGSKITLLFPEGHLLANDAKITKANDEIVEFDFFEGTFFMPQGSVTVHGSLSKHWDGDGTEQSPYVIKTAEGLNLLSKNVNTGKTYEGKFFILAEDISYPQAENNYKAIGNHEKFFAGVFDGKGHTIKGIHINEDIYSIGIFGAVKNAVIKNLTLADANITGRENVGGIVGEILEGSLIENCHVLNSVEIKSLTSSKNIGGIAGENHGTIKNCLYFGHEIDGGAIAGKNFGEIKNSYYVDKNLKAHSGILAYVINLHESVTAKSDEGVIYGGKFYAPEGAKIELQYHAAIPEDHELIFSITGDVSCNDGEFFMPAKNVFVTPEISRKKYAVNFINENGDEETAEAIIFHEEYDEELRAGFYALTKNINFEKIILRGDAALILCDGAEMNIENGIDGQEYNLTIYAHENGTGTLKVFSIEAKNFAFNGGKFFAGRGGISAGTINLNSTTKNDVINSEKYNGAVQISKIFGDGEGNFYDGELDDEEKNEIAGKNLRPAYKIDVLSQNIIAEKNYALFGETVELDVRKNFSGKIKINNFEIEAFADENFYEFKMLAEDVEITAVIDTAQYWQEDDEENSYTLKNADALDVLALYVNDGNDTAGKIFRLGGDVEYEEKNFTPIGTISEPFKGTFDGGNFKISGVNFTGEAQYAGLFGYIEGGSVKNIRLEKCAFESTKEGAFVGSIAGGIVDGKISDCVIVDVNVKANEGTAGGVAGKNNGELENCLCLGENAKIDGKVKGAIAGENSGSVKVCYFVGDFENISLAERGYTVSLDRAAENATLEFVFSDNVKIASVDVLQADNSMLIYGGEVYAAEGSEVKISAEAKAHYEIASFEPGGGKVEGKQYIFEMPACDTTVRVACVPVRYKINYDLDGGTLEKSNPASYTVESEDFTLNNPIKTGYNFWGWTVDGEIITKILSGSTGDKNIKANWTINQYTITFDTKGGSAVNAITQNYGTAITKPETPTRTGYTFTGWDKEIPATMPAENITLTANWTVNKHTITFDTKGGSVINSITQDYGTAVTKPENPTRMGYTFAGWDKEIPATMPAENITLTANWTVNKYTITFDTQSGIAINAITQDYGTAITKPQDPKKTGYTFAEWDREIPATMPAENITLTAKWTVNKYTIMFDTKGGSAINAITQDYGTAITKPEEPTKTGYTFAGWDKDFPATMPAENITLTVKWIINKYTITFDTKGGTVINSITQNYGSAITKPANPTRIGYTFAGWDRELPATMPADNITFTAKWTVNKYTITFDTKGGLVINSITQDYGTAITKPQNPTRAGYTFAGWDREIPATMPAENITMTAKWTVNKYTITFDTKGGSVINAITQNYGTAINKPENPTRTGYTFTGWDKEFPATMPAENITLTAQWEIITYTISYDLCGGSLESDKTNPTTYTVESPLITLNNPERTGYKFSGWSFDNTVSTEITIQENSTGDRKYFAQWEAIRYALTYDLDGGTLAKNNPASYTIESSDITLNNPTKTGYTFADWTIDGEIIAKIPSGSIGDKTLKANWTVNKYTITFNTKGGTVINSITQNYGTALTKPKEPTKAGYTFAGWDKEIPATMPAENITLTANWVVNKYTIKFDTKGGSAINAITQDYGMAITKPETPTRTGYIFAGWDREFPATMPAENITLTAKWTVNKYTITFDTKGGSTINAIIQDYGTAISKPENPTRTGYTFAGWDKEIPATMPAENITLTAKWIVNKYSITFDTKGGSAINAIIQDYGTAITKPENPTRTGYTFVGWNKDFPNTMPAENITLTAQWEIITYTISYDLCGGLLGNDKTNPTTYTIESQLITLNNPEKTGYKFSGWSFDNEVSTEIMIQENSTGDRKYFAQWEVIRYALTYDPDGGTLAKNNPASYTIESEDFTLNNPTKTGYTFAGWIIDGEIIAKIPSGSTGDKTLKAKWTVNKYTITFDTKGGSAINVITQDYGTAITKPENTTRTGYTFAGWDKEIPATMPAKNITLTAQWKIITYTISYDLHGGQATNPATYNIESETFTLTNPTREGYSFTGWIGENLAAPTMTITIPRGSTGNKKYSTTWSEIPPTLLPTTQEILAHKGEPINIKITASQGINLNWSMTGNLPDGLTFTHSESEANISGTPALGTSGKYHLTITAQNSAGSSKAEIFIDVSENPQSITSETQKLGDTTRTTFKNFAGENILSADISIAASTDYKTIAKNHFAANMIVSVQITAFDLDYDSYNCLMKISGLPDWLAISGDTDFSGELNSIHHHKITLHGTPGNIFEEQEIFFTALVKIFGKNLTLESSANKIINFSVIAPEITPEKLISMDVEIHGSDFLKMDTEKSTSQNFSVSVYGFFFGGISRVLSQNEYVLNWNTYSADKIFFEGGTLTVNKNASAGTHQFNIVAEAVSGNITAKANKLVTVNVENISPAPPKIIEISEGEIFSMTHTQLQHTFENAEDIIIVGEVADLSEVIATIETVTEIQNLDLSRASGLKEILLDENNSVRGLNISGNSSIKEVNIFDCGTLKSLDVSSCGLDENSLNIFGCENLVYLDVSDNKFSRFDYDEENLSALEELVCYGQKICVENISDTFLFASANHAGNVKNVKAFDFSGEQIPAEYNSQSGIITFEGKPAKITYDYSTGFKDIKMDVTVFIAEKPNVEPETNTQTETQNYSLGGGCNYSFWGLGALILLAGFVKIHRCAVVS